MIRKFPIIIACAPEDVSYYRNFPLPNEELQVVPYGQAVCSVLSQEIDLIVIDCGFDARLGLRLRIPMPTDHRFQRKVDHPFQSNLDHLFRRKLDH